MNELALNELWDKTIEELTHKTSKPTVKTWFDDVKPVGFFDGILRLSVPNKMVKVWLEQKFHYLLLKIVKGFINDLKQIEYIINEEKNKTIKSPRLSKSLTFYKKINLFDINPSTNLNPRYRFDNFVVGSNNELAFAAAQGIVNDTETKVNPLFIYGGVGLGKTHLLQAIGNELVKRHKALKKIKYITSEQFTTELVNSFKNHTIEDFKVKFRELDCLILDDVHFLSGKTKSQEELFHTFNILYDLSKQIVFSSDRPPGVIPDIEQRLRSRFEGGLVVDITPPDYETRLAILKIKCQEKNYFLDEQILALIANKITRNIRELEGALNLIIFVMKSKNLDTLSEERVDELLKDYLKQTYKKITPKKLIKVVCDFYNIKESDLFRKTRKINVVKPRQIVMYLLRELTKMSFSSIGEILNNRDHTTIIYSYEKISKELDINVEFSEEIKLLKSKLSED
jgi:chromosomal replication initiator protein